MPDSLADRAAPPAVATVPGPHLGLTWRTLQPGDADDVRALLQRCAEADRPLLPSGPNEVDRALARPATDGEADSLGGFDTTGELRASAFVHAPSGGRRTAKVFVAASIDPAWRGRGVGRALLVWQDERARQMLAGCDQSLPGRIAAYVDEHAQDRRRLYAAAGFSPKRSFRVMRRRLAEEPEATAVPEGIEIRPWDPEIDGAVHQAHNETFQDHWGSEPMSDDTWAGLREELEPSWSMVAVDGATGEIAGYALTARHEHQWQALGHSEGFTELLGVRRPYRGGGLAKALLTRVLVALHRDGIDSAGLDVDDDHPAGANDLYQRLGYESQQAQILYTIEI